MNVLYIINGLGFSNNTGIGGSDKRAVEMARNLKLIDPEGKYDILTTESGYKIFTDNEKLETNYHVIEKPSWWPNQINNYLVGRILSYIYAFFYSIFMTRKVKGYDIYFSSSDFFFDLIPAYIYAKKYAKKTHCMVHHMIVDPKKRTGSHLINLLLFCSQRLGFFIIKKLGFSLFLYETPEGKIIKEKVFKDIKKVFYVKNGIDANLIDLAQEQEKIYEACFMGGIRYSKGIKEFVPIWKIVTEKYPIAKFLVIGGGSEEMVNELKNDVEKNGLKESIIFTGPLSGTKLFEEMKKSKIFLFPSHEEGWGISVCEAMYCGLPVIAYNLPAFEIFGQSIDTVEKGNYKKLAEKTLEYLSNESKIKEKSEMVRNEAKKYTWPHIAEEEISIYEKIIS